MNTFGLIVVFLGIGLEYPIIIWMMGHPGCLRLHQVLPVALCRMFLAGPFVALIGIVICRIFRPRQSSPRQVT